MPSIDALSLRIPVRSSTLISLDFPLTTLIGIIEKRKQFSTCTQETTRAKIERLRSARLIHGDQQIITKHAKPSPISEGVAENQINSQPCKGINLIIWHMQARRASRVVTVHDAVKESGWVLPHPSAVFHAYASADTLCVAWTLFYCAPMKRGKVSSNSSTHEAIQFGDYICPVCISTFKWLFIQTQPMRALIDKGGGYLLRAPNFRSDHSHPSHPVFSTFF
jgi:hypothetical protein